MKKVYVVPHSHWDREWYFNLDDSNLLLGENLTYLINFLENHPDYPSYTFDGQSSIIEEYLVHYPENEKRLAKLIKEKRIIVGPWYTQCDSLLINKESIIRNLLYGINTAEKFGHSSNIGYLPDIFGQNQYLPSIFKNFNIEDAIFQRGIETSKLNNNLNFIWASPDNIEINANNLYLGYGPGKFLDSSDDYINNTLLPMLTKLSQLNVNSNNLLLPAGGDQVLIREHFPSVIKELNNKKIGYEFVLSNYEEFMEDTWKNNNFNNIITGELRACEKSRIHRTIGSQRYDIKELNSQIENKILRILEPLLVIGKELSIPYPQKLLDTIWKLLFDVHSHDSIGGCNSDSTNEEIILRLKKVEKLVNGIINITKKKIALAISKNLKKDNIIIIYNTSLSENEKYKKITLFTKSNAPYLTTLNNERIDSEIIKSEYISGGKKVVVTAEGDKEEEIPGYYRIELYLKNLALNPLGYETFLFHENDYNYQNTSTSSAIENNFYKISLNKKELILENKITKETISNFLSFETCIDDGDSYDFSPKIGDCPLIFNNFEFSKSFIGKNINQIELISKLSSPRILEIKTTIELKADSKIINISHELVNTEENHRLRVLIDSNFKDILNSYSDSGFSLISHPIRDINIETWKEKKFVEAPVAIYNMENMVILKSENLNFGFYGVGLKEYEILNQSLAVTLFRSVGFLGKDNLQWRPGRASGINNKIVYTPDAQLKKKLLFNYAITSTNEISSYDHYAFLNEFLDDYTFYQIQNLNTFEERLERFEIPLLKANIPEKISLFALNNENLFVSVCKKAENSCNTIIRIFNPGEEPQNIKFDFEITETNLKELELKQGKEFCIAPKSYKTFKI